MYYFILEWKIVYLFFILLYFKKYLFDNGILNNLSGKRKEI